MKCPHCIPPAHYINAVPGHVFVGWGHGWQPCPHCQGSEELPDTPTPRDPLNVAALELVSGSYEDAVAARYALWRAAYRFAAAELESHPHIMDDPKFTPRAAAVHLRTKGTEP